MPAACSAVMSAALFLYLLLVSKHLSNIRCSFSNQSGALLLSICILSKTVLSNPKRLSVFLDVAYVVMAVIYIKIQKSTQLIVFHEANNDVLKFCCVPSKSSSRKVRIIRGIGSEGSVVSSKNIGYIFRN